MIDWGGIVIAGIGLLTSIGSYFVGKRKRQNDFLSDLQSSIDMLAEKNKEQMDEIVKLRTQNVELIASVASLKSQNEQLKKEVEELNAKLENVKTITRTK